MDSLAQTVEKGPALRLSLIRGFELRSGDSVIRVALSAQRLVAFVALQDRAVRRLRASGVLWMDAPQQRANSSLRSALWRTPSPDGRPLIEASSTHLWLNPIVEVDFREIVSRAVSLLDRDDGGQSADNLHGQFRQFDDDLLPDWYDDWVLVQRERFRQLRLHALEAICHRLTDLGRYALALEAGASRRGLRAVTRERAAPGHPGAPDGGQRRRGPPPVPGVRSPAGRRARGPALPVHGPAA